MVQFLHRGRRIRRGNDKRTARDRPALRLEVLEDRSLMTAATATFLGSDVVTLGNWVSKYGVDGYDVIDGKSALPSVRDDDHVGRDELPLDGLDDRPPRPARLVHLEHWGRRVPV